MKPLLLGVNIDHAATLRQARGGQIPDIMAVAREAVAGGADGITVHLREDRRHIQDEDVVKLHANAIVPVNLEMSIAEDIVEFALELSPSGVCLVPEKRDERTTESGLDVCSNKQRITTVCTRLAAAGSRVSLFVDPLPEQLNAAAATGAAAVELHTGDYANASSDRRENVLQRLRHAASFAHDLGLLVHAGHGLDVDNVGAIAAINYISELNIGYSIICRSLFCGMRSAVQEMKQAIQQRDGGI